ncbi:hypothetical protein LTR95_007052 [Oleoguttula sp. CCFEE 5521]
MTGEWTRFGTARSFVTNLNIKLELGRDTPGSQQQLLHEAGQVRALHELLIRCPRLSRTKVVFCMLRQLLRAASRIERLARSVLDVAESADLGLQRTVDLQIVAEIRQYFELFLEEARAYWEATWTVWHAVDYSHDTRHAILAASLPKLRQGCTSMHIEMTNNLRDEEQDVQNNVGASYYTVKVDGIG